MAARTRDTCHVMAAPAPDWECVSQLGSGGFGIVHVWRHRATGQCLALKKCKLGSDITLTTRSFADIFC